MSVWISIGVDDTGVPFFRDTNNAHLSLEAVHDAVNLLITCHERADVLAGVLNTHGRMLECLAVYANFTNAAVLLRDFRPPASFWRLVIGDGRSGVPETAGGQHLILEDCMGQTQKEALDERLAALFTDLRHVTMWGAAYYAFPAVFSRWAFNLRSVHLNGDVCVAFASSVLPRLVALERLEFGDQSGETLRARAFVEPFVDAVMRLPALCHVVICRKSHGMLLFHEALQKTGGMTPAVFAHTQVPRYLCARNGAKRGGHTDVERVSRRLVLPYSRREVCVWVARGTAVKHIVDLASVFTSAARRKYALFAVGERLDDTRTIEEYGVDDELTLELRVV